MAIVPGKLDGIDANVLHSDQLQIGTDRTRIERSLSRPLVAAGRTRALRAERPVGDAIDPLTGPRDLENLLGLQSPNISWRIVH